MSVMPAPWVEVDGIRIYCGSDRLDQGVTILDDLSIDWGREHPLADRGTTTAQFRLWDADGYWLARAVATLTPSSPSPILGVSVVIGWTAGTVTRIIFRGTISKADISPSKRTVTEHTTRRGWILDITATERVTDLGSAKVRDNVQYWPAESAIVRANRIKDEITAAGVDIAAVYFEPDTVSWPMGRTKVQDATILQLLDEFYASFGLSWDYRPDENVTRPAPIRPAQFIYLKLFYRVPDTAGDHVLSTVPATLTGFGEDTATYWPAPVRGCDVTVDGRMAIDRSDRNNFIRITYLRADGSEFTTAGTWAGVTKTRVREVKSWLNLDSPNQVNADRIYTHQWDYVYSSNAPAMPKVTLDTRHTGGFMGVEQAFTLTRCSQSWSRVVISGNQYAAALGLSPDFQVIGGTVRYSRDRWIVEMIPAWVAGITAKRANTWQEMTDGNAVWAALSWNDPTARLDESITWADLTHIANGLIDGPQFTQTYPAQEVP